MARPTKLTENFLAVAEEVINTGNNALVHTDEDLLFLINEKLSEKERIADSTFEYWKAGQFSECSEEQKNIGEKFLGLLKKALIIQRDNLMDKLQDDKGAWQRWAWIIERKFKEWRLPNKHYHGGDPDNKTPIEWSVINYAGATKDTPV